MPPSDPRPTADALAAIGLLMSGGLDSSILLGHFLQRGYRVQPFYIRSFLVWEAEELRAARQFLRAMQCPQLADLVCLELPLSDLYDNHWSVTGRDVPDETTPDEAVYLPGRNALLIVKAAIWASSHGVDRLALGVLGSNPFSDATPRFFRSIESTIGLALSTQIHIEAPFAQLHKRQVMEIGRRMPLELTFSCLSPVQGQHCGRCNKCAERQAAFRLIDCDDPTHYAASAAATGPQLHGP